MDITIFPTPLQGSLSVIPSKSQAHRILIAAAFADGPTRIFCPETNGDIEATADCLQALGSGIQKTPEGFYVTPITSVPETAELCCRDSGSTLRFLLPIAGALGINARFRLEGRLPERPLSPLWEELQRMGCRLSRPAETTVAIGGRLRPGVYTMDGGVSSQFITGLLLAFPLMDGPSRLTVTGVLQSRPYVELTRAVLKAFGVSRSGQGSYHSPGTISVEGDWSSAAFFLGANALGSQVTLSNLDPRSPQGDRAALQLMPALNTFQTISAADIPDLIPILSVVAACKEGALFTQVQRLRLKESDRVEAIVSMIRSLGGRAEADDSTLRIFGTGLRGGTVDSRQDHRIAMSAAIAATACREPVTIRDAHCAGKSYPRFFEEFKRLGGNYEQYIR